MQQLKRILILGIALQASFFALEAGVENKQNSIDISDLHLSRHHCDHYGPTGPQGPTGAPGDPGVPFGNFASFFLTTSSGEVDVTPGENVVFNNQLALSGIGYDTTTGVFTLSPGTYAVTYFFAPFSIPAVNMYVNGQLILNSPLGGNSTVLTLTESTNTLTLQYISTNSFASPGANQSWASIAIFQID